MHRQRLCIVFAAGGQYTLVQHTEVQSLVHSPASQLDHTSCSRHVIARTCAQVLCLLPCTQPPWRDMSLGASSRKASGMEKGLLHMIRHGRMEVSVRRGGTWCELDKSRVREESSGRMYPWGLWSGGKGEGMRQKPFPAPLLTDPMGQEKTPRGHSKVPTMGNRGQHKRSHSTSPILAQIPWIAENGDPIGQNVVTWLINTTHSTQRSSSSLAELTVTTVHGGENPFVKCLCNTEHNEENK